MNKRDTIIAVVLLVITVGMFYGIFYFKNHYLEEKNQLEADIKSQQETYDNLELQVRGQRDHLIQEKERLVLAVEALPTYEDYKVMGYVDDGELLYYLDTVLSKYYLYEMKIETQEPKVNDRNEAVYTMKANLIMREAEFFTFLKEMDDIEVGHRTIICDAAYGGYDVSDTGVLTPVIEVSITTEFYCYNGYVDPNRDYPYNAKNIERSGTMFERMQRGG